MRAEEVAGVMVLMKLHVLLLPCVERSVPSTLLSRRSPLLEKLRVSERVIEKTALSLPI